jgi:hypothetical protein
MTMTWWSVGAWLVALAACVWWLWRDTDMDEVMSPGWLEENCSAEEEETTYPKEFADALRYDQARRDAEADDASADIDWDKEAEAFDAAAEFERRRQWANHSRKETIEAGAPSSPGRGND